MNRLFMILCSLFTVSLYSAQRAQPAVPRSIPIEVPVILGAGHEELNTSEMGSYLTLDVFSELITQKHNSNSSYLLARVITQDQNSHFYTHYFDAHEFCQYLNEFTTEEENLEGHFAGGKRVSPPGLSGRNLLMYHPFRHNRFFADLINHLPITLGAHYFELAKGASKFTYLCSHKDLFIHRYSHNGWISPENLRNYFQANEKNDNKTQQAMLKILTRQKAAFPPIHATNASSVVIHISPELGAQDSLNLMAQDPITKQSFAQLMEQSRKEKTPYLIARFVYQDAQGNYVVSYCDAHAFNTTYFGGYPLYQDTQKALLYFGSLESLSGEPEMKNLYAVLEEEKHRAMQGGILNRNILYFSYDPSSPELGFTFLCSHFDLFVSEEENRDYWKAVLEANQNFDAKLKKDALARLQTAAFQKKTKVLSEARKKIAAQQAAAEAQQAKAQLAALAEEEDALSALFEAETNQALTRLYQELTALASMLAR